ncbi:hypothetical protein CEP51_012068 [Fusarium floridanum]|uniref:C2H2-type domain-containing protein n=1 Tax=Fusarium floridanum TaxID=1325733 RepID=A0A428R1A6_9HYPO|nr:hypothetical protein CEP51_012068 [Fusarium floridanum]
MGAFIPDLRSQPIPTTTADPTGSPTDPSRLGSAPQLTLSPGFQQQFQVQETGLVTEDSTDNIVVATSRPIDINQHRCPECGKILARQDSLRRHRQTQHNREVEEHLCPHKSCKRSRPGSGFSRYDGLRRHLKACKSRLRRAATVALGSVDSQPESGNETRKDSQARSSRHETSSTQGANDRSSQQCPASNWEEELKKHYEAAKEVWERKKREVEEGQRVMEEAQRVMESCETLIENAKKERTT